MGASEVLQTQLAMGLTIIQIPRRSDTHQGRYIFRKIIGIRPLVQKAINQHLYALMRQVLYGAACNRTHSMEERCARWLLMTHDRAAADSFPLTREFSFAYAWRTAGEGERRHGHVEEGRVYPLRAARSSRLFLVLPALTIRSQISVG